MTGPVLSERALSRVVGPRAVARVTATVMVGVLIVVTLAGPAGAQDASPMRAGDVVLTQIDAPDEAFTQGGSAALFRLRLPAGAECQGDSANDDYRIQSFLVPGDDDPAALGYESTKPAGEGRWALYDDTTANFSDRLLFANDGPGQPGGIPDPGVFSFAVFLPGMLPEGRYRVGIACTSFGRETTRYWDTEIVITDDPSDEPAGFTWVVADPPGDLPSSGGGNDATLPLAGLVLVLAAATVGAYAVRRRHRPTDTSPTKEPS